MSPQYVTPQHAHVDGTRIGSFALVVFMHLLGAYLLLLFSPMREAVQHATTLMVTLIREQPKIMLKPTEVPKPLPLKPQLTRPEPVPIPVIATASVPADISATPPTQQQPTLPTRVTPPSPTPTAVVPPKFDADYLENPPPVYPRLSKRLGEVGNVSLMVFVDPTGAPGTINIQTSSGHDRLDQAAAEAVRRWRFVPAKNGDRTVAAWVLVPIYFSLKQ